MLRIESTQSKEGEPGQDTKVDHHVDGRVSLPAQNLPSRLRRLQETFTVSSSKPVN